MSKLHEIDSILDSVYNSSNFRETIQYLSSKETLFDLLESLLSYAAESGFDIKTKNWKDVSSFLLKYWRYKLSDIQILSDYLCYDFVTSKMSGAYPAFLFPEYESFKNKCLGILKLNSDSRSCLKGITPKEYSKFLFFSPRSMHFPENLCRQNEIIALYKDRLFNIV